MILFDRSHPIAISDPGSSLCSLDASASPSNQSI